MDAADALREENARLQREVADLRQRLLQAQKLGSIGTLASSITHEFNNILTTVINYAKMGVRHRDDAVRDKAFDKILAAGQRAAKITTGMLSYARARGDRRDVFSLAQLVQDVLVLVEKDLQVHRVSLQLDLQPDAYAEVNASQVQQVLLNLIINARQAMEPGGTLCLATRRNEPAGTAEILVRDTGAAASRRTSSRRSLIRSTRRRRPTRRDRGAPDWGCRCARTWWSRTTGEFA